MSKMGKIIMQKKARDLIFQMLRKSAQSDESLRRYEQNKTGGQGRGSDLGANFNRWQKNRHPLNFLKLVGWTGLGTNLLLWNGQVGHRSPVRVVGAKSKKFQKTQIFTKIARLLLSYGGVDRK